MNDNPSAILIRRNGTRATVEGLSNAQFLALIAEVGSKYFAGYILNPTAKPSKKADNYERTKHTPGPWKVDPAMPTQIAHGYSTVAETALTYGLQTAIANAAHIVQSVNAFNDLLEAAQFLFGAIESGELVRDISRDAQADWGQRMMHFTVNLGKAQAAIAKAEAQP